MNKKQRIKNRENAKQLRKVVVSKHICENCGQPGGHWVQVPTTLEELMQSQGTPSGFWTCDKYYGVDGARII